MDRRKMFRVLLVAAVLAVVCSRAYPADYYTWTDDEGNVHLSDSLGNVPERYRGQIESRRLNSEQEDEQAPAADVGAPTGSVERRRAGSGGPGEERAGTQGKRARKHEVKFTAREGSARRVIVQARINGAVTAPVVIDTGAPTSVITASLAEKLGLFDNDHGKLLVTASGIGGDAPAVRTFLDRIEVGGAKSEFVPTTIVEELSPAFEGLLGLDFVANYLVTIDSVKNVVIFEELPVNPEHFAGRDKDWWTGLFKEFGSYRSGWKAYSDFLERKIRASLNSTNNDDIGRKELADEQCREADKLIDKLNAYASQYSVPVNWRRY